MSESIRVPGAGGSDLWIVGCGYVGQALGLRASASGWRVWGTRRRPEGLPAPIRPLRGDVGRPDGLELPPLVDALVYAVSAEERSPDAYARAYRDGVTNVLEACASADLHPRRAIFVSSTSVWGQSDGSWVDEQTPASPPDETSRLVLEAELAFEARARGLGCRAVVARLGGIYGPGRTSLVERVAAGRAEFDPAAPNFTNRIHRDDAAAALLHLVSLPDPEPVYAVVDSDPAPLRVVQAFLSEQLEAPAPRPRSGRARQTRRSNKRVRNLRLLRSGFSLTHPTYREGYGALLAAREDAG